MAVLIPELRLKAIVDELLQKIRTDYNESVAAGDETKSFLHRVFNGNSIDGFDFFVQAKSLLFKGDEDPQKLETRIMFDRDRASMPTIHITLPREVRGKENAIGINRDDRNDIDNGDGTTTGVYSRSFGTSYDMAVTSSDPLQVVIIYNILKSGFIAITDSLELNGMKIPDYSGGDVNIDPALVPNAYLRSFSVNIDYLYNVPNFMRHKVIQNINFNSANLE